MAGNGIEDDGAVFDVIRESTDLVQGRSAKAMRP